MDTTATPIAKVSDEDAQAAREIEVRRSRLCVLHTALVLQRAEIDAKMAEVLAEVVRISGALSEKHKEYRARYGVPDGAPYDFVAGCFVTAGAVEPKAGE